MYPRFPDGWYKGGKSNPGIDQLIKTALEKNEGREHGAAFFVMDDRLKQWLEERFPNTAEDTLQDEYSQKIIVEGYGLIKRMEQSENVRSQAEDDFYQYLQKEFRIMEENKVRLDVCIDELERIKAEKEASAGDSTKQESLSRLEDKAKERLDYEMDNWKDQIKGYDDALKRYKALTGPKDADAEDLEMKN